MPRRAPHPCANPGCPGLAEAGHRFCPEHRREEQRRYDRERGSAARRGYGARWRRLRLMILARHPLCADPYGIHAERGEIVAATEIDHIIPRSAGGTDDPANLQPLCRQCHSRKTAREDGRWGGGRKSLGPRERDRCGGLAHAAAKSATGGDAEQ